MQRLDVGVDEGINRVTWHIALSILSGGTPIVRHSFNWLDSQVSQMATDMQTTRTLMFTMAAKEGGWTKGDLAHNMPLNNPFGVNNIKNGKAVGNKMYPDLAAAAHDWERLYADRVQGTQSPDDFVYGLQHPGTGFPYNTAHKDDYEDEFQRVYNSVVKFMRLCGIHE